MSRTFKINYYLKLKQPEKYFRGEYFTSSLKGDWFKFGYGSGNRSITVKNNANRAYKKRQRQLSKKEINDQLD